MIMVANYGRANLPGKLLGTECILTHLFMYRVIIIDDHHRVDEEVYDQVPNNVLGAKSVKGGNWKCVKGMIIFLSLLSDAKLPNFYD